MTYDRYLRTAEGGIYNLVDGMFLHEPGPGRRHQRAAGSLFALLRAFVEPRGLGEVYAAPLDVHLGPDQVYEPDVFFVGTASLGHLRERDLFAVAPDLAVDVLSPYSAGYDRGAKRRGYARHGCREYWLVDPVGQTVEVFARSAAGRLGPAAVYRGGDVLRSPRLPELALPLSEVFQP